MGTGYSTGPVAWIRDNSSIVMPFFESAVRKGQSVDPKCIVHARLKGNEKADK